MAKEKSITRVLKLNLPAGEVNPAIIGKDLAPTGINLLGFSKQYNDLTKNDRGKIIPAKVTVYEDRSFSIELKTPPTSFLIKEKLGIKKGASKTGTEVVGTLTKQQVREIAEMKIADLNCTSIESAMKMIEGTAKNMGVKISE